MRISLIGADYEENLGVGAVAAACRLAGHRVEVLPFNQSEQIDQITTRIVSTSPDLVGLSIQFQHRSFDFLQLAKSLRDAGFFGHITCGGQFPTMAYRDVLSNWHSLDTVVLHEGEVTIVELLQALGSGSPLDQVRGLAIRNERGEPFRTGERAIVDDLNQLPIPDRYRPHSKHFDIPFIPIMASRGCWGACAFCSISSYYRDARSTAGGRLFRSRNPEHVAAEMALLWHAAKGQAIFCFHDDNFLLPRPADSIARLRSIRDALDKYGVGKISIIGKCRPETITSGLAHQLRDLGVIRLYVGVENTSHSGAEHLNRKTQHRRIREALAACRDADIFTCYNLLIFEPDARLDDVEENLNFIREHAAHPVNFCRAEAYCGTPLQLKLSNRGNLNGSYLGYDYRIEDDRTELLFRMCAAAFRQRNFDNNGVHNRYLSLGYQTKLLQQYYPSSNDRLLSLVNKADKLTRSIALETADFLQGALQFARTVDLEDREIIVRQTATLGLRIADADAIRHAELDDLDREMAKYVGQCKQPRFIQTSRETLARLTQQFANGIIAGSCILVASGMTACAESRKGGTHPVDQLPPDSGVDSAATDSGREGGSGGTITISDPAPYDAMVVDPLPPDSGRSDGAVGETPPDAALDSNVVDPLPRDSMIVDPVPRDSMIVDPVPYDSMIVDPLPPDSGSDSSVDASPDADLHDATSSNVDIEQLLYKRQVQDPSIDIAGPNRKRSTDRKSKVASVAIVDNWRDTSPVRSRRSNDLPLYDPPHVKLATERLKEGVRVRLVGGPQTVSTLWQSDGRIVGDGRTVTWYPESDTDQISVAVRTRGGIAVLAVRAKGC